MYAPEKECPYFQLYLSSDYDKPLTSGSGDHMEATWSPDGKRIAFTFIPRTSPQVAGRQSFIEVIDADGSNRQRLTQSGTDRSPGWSPAGDKIAYVADSGNSAGSIYLKNADGTKVQLLLQGASASALAWSPAGKQLAYTVRKPTELHEYIMDADGSNLRRLTYNHDEDWDGVWSPDGKTFAYIATDAKQGAAIYLTTDGGKSQKPIKLLDSWILHLMKAVRRSIHWPGRRTATRSPSRATRGNSRWQ